MEKNNYNFIEDVLNSEERSSDVLLRYKKHFKKLHPYFIGENICKYSNNPGENINNLLFWAIGSKYLCVNFHEVVYCLINNLYTYKTNNIFPIDTLRVLEDISLLFNLIAPEGSILAIKDGYFQFTKGYSEGISFGPPPENLI
ncbi:MAG: hypothetical protein ACOCRX_05090 [Candidatus Woesearchaeota archaeon]